MAIHGNVVTETCRNAEFTTNQIITLSDKLIKMILTTVMVKPVSLHVAYWSQKTSVSL